MSKNSQLSSLRCKGTRITELDISNSEYIDVLSIDNRADLTVYYDSTTTTFMYSDISERKEQYPLVNWVDVSNTASEPCAHVLDMDNPVITKKATCTETGRATYSCKYKYCSYTEEREIAKVDHTWAGSWTIDKAATCGKKSQKSIHCSVCGTVKAGSTVEIPATGNHTFANYTVTKKPTVLASGTKTGSCTRCGAKDVRTIAKLTGTIKFTSTKLSIQVNKSVNLKSLVTGLTAGDSIASWTSSNKKIAAVNSSGKVTAKKAGSATITVTLASGTAAKLKLTVQEAAVKTTKISIAFKKVTLAIGKKRTLTPVVTPITTQDKVTYKTSNKKVVTVDAKGNIKAVKSGTAVITIKSGSKSVKVTVTVPAIQPTKITGVPSSKSLKKGKTYTLKPKLSPKGAESKVTYTSSNKKVATVNSKGKVKAKGKGTAVIKVKAGKITATCKITVK